MLRFAAYTRVSTGEQSSTGDQLAAIEDAVLRLGGTLTCSETDVLTGHDDRRAGYQRILAMARRREIDALIVWKIDRLGRDHIEGIRAARELEMLGIRVHSATEPTDDPFVRDFMFLLANRESRVLAERVRLRQKGNVREGNWQWPAPLGYRIVYRTPDDKRNRRPQLQPDSNAPLILRLFEVAAASSHSLRQLRDFAHAMGLQTSRGGPIGRAYLHHLLTNPAYVGDIASGRRPHGKFTPNTGKAQRDDWTVFEDAHPAIVDRLTFAAVERALAEHKSLPAKIRGSSYLLTGLIRCGHCGGKMYGAPGGRGNFTYACYRGTEYAGCELRSAGGKGIDAAVKLALRSLSITPEIRAAAEAMVREHKEQRRGEADGQRRNLLREKRRHEETRTRHLRNYMDHGRGVVDPVLFAELQQQETDAIRIIDNELRGLEEAPPLAIGADLAFLEAVAWDEYDEEAWREAASLFIEQVVVRKDGRGNRWKLPKVEIAWTPTAAVIREAVAAAV